MLSEVKYLKNDDKSIKSEEYNNCKYIYNVHHSAQIYEVKIDGAEGRNR